MIAVTGANGQLGRHVLNALARRAPQTPVIAAVRTPEKAADLQAGAIRLRQADYDAPETLRAAFDGVETVLLISSSEVGQRARQHHAVIEAAKAAGVKALVYTSILKADVSPMQLAVEHRETEAELARSGLQTVILRNSWYLENYNDSLKGAVASGVLAGAAGTGVINAATRADYAEAAVTVLLDPAAHAGRVYELAGQPGMTLAQLAQAASAITGQDVHYADMTPDAYANVLIDHGVPEGFANILADSDAGMKLGALESASTDLATLLGHAPTPWRDHVEQLLAR